MSLPPVRIDGACEEARPFLERFSRLWEQALDAQRAGQSAVVRAVAEDMARALVRGLVAQVRHDAAGEAKQ